mmetsp:Transcript_39660/g.91651  ORF Transcript_39660/g.91651 Transcript_39660/m.91651 type:complete len:124 (-) Transcript_39660:54-425(-)
MSTAVWEAVLLYRLCFTQAALKHPLDGKMRCPDPVSNTTVKACGSGPPTCTWPKYAVLYATTLPSFDTGTYCFFNGMLWMEAAFVGATKELRGQAEDVCCRRQIALARRASAGDVLKFEGSMM